MNPSPQAPSQQPAALPLVALILGIVGFCIPPLFLVAIVLAIVSLVKGSEPAYAARKTLAIITLVLGVLYVPVVGVLAAIAIPNFIRFQARSKQVECKAQLRAAYVAEKSWYAEHDAYLIEPAELGMVAEPNARALLRFAQGNLGSQSLLPSTGQGRTPAPVLDRGIPADLRSTLGATGQCPDCNVTIACANNIDNDDTVDVWSISTAQRTDPTGMTIEPGTPYNHVNDVTD
jgi:type II secretory pathway pseudopilin PulG